MRRLAFAAVAVCAAALGGPAHADCDPDAHRSTCFDADTFWPHGGPGYFNFVGGPATTPPGTFVLGLFNTYLTRPVVLLLPSADPNGAEVVAVDHLVDTTLVFSLGLTERLDASVALPVIAYRSGVGISPLTSQHSEPIAHTALRDVRAGAGYRLFGCPAGAADCRERFGLGARFELSLPTGDESSFAGDRSIVAIPSLFGEVRRSPFVAGVELGGRIRRTTDLAGSRIGPQVMFAAGLGADLWKGANLGAFVEAMILPTLVAQHELSFDASSGARAVSNSRPLLAPAEWQAGFRSADWFADGVSLTLGAGSGLLFTGEAGVTTPRYRVMLSVRYAPRSASPGPATESRAANE